MACVDKLPSERCIAMDDGAKIYTKVEGSAGGTPVVLVHGWGFNTDMWKNAIPYLTGLGYDYEVVAIDLRGFGHSDKPGAPDPLAVYNYDRWARDLSKVIHDPGLDLHDITLVGYSMGGGVAMHYAATAADPRVKKLLLLEATGPCVCSDLGGDGMPRLAYETTIWLIEQGKKEDNEWWYQLALKELTGIKAPFVNHADEQWVMDMLSLATPDALIGGLKEFRDRDLTNELANIDAETKICHGYWDLFVRKGVAQAQLDNIGAATPPIITFDQSGHGLFVEQKSKFNEELDWR